MAEPLSPRLARLPLYDRMRLADRLRSPVSDEELLGLAFHPNDRVVILDTGEVGEVIRGRKINLVVPTP